MIAAFGVAGPTYRISDDDLERFSSLVAVAAGEATAQLGGGWQNANQLPKG